MGMRVVCRASSADNRLWLNQQIEWGEEQPYPSPTIATTPFHHHQHALSPSLLPCPLTVTIPVTITTIPSHHHSPNNPNQSSMNTDTRTTSHLGTATGGLIAIFPSISSRCGPMWSCSRGGRCPASTRRGKSEIHCLHRTNTLGTCERLSI